MAELLSEQFAKSFSTPVDYYSNNVTPNSIPQIEPLMFTIEDIKTAIKELRPTSASGPDGFPAILLRNCVNSLSEPLTIFWQKSIDTETIPEQLLQSIITPQHKSGSKALPINYRPIALTSHIIKVFEKVIRNHVTTHLTKNNLLNDNQHGFRSGRSCLSELLEHYDTLLSYLEEGFNVDVIYLDFAKAFDKLDIKIALEKMKKLGINNKIFKWIEALLNDRKQKVIVNGINSEPGNVKSGVPQGSVLGPLIF